MKREDCTPGLVVRYSDAYLESTSAVDRSARFVIAAPCPVKRGIVCRLCARGIAPITEGWHIHPDNLEAT